MLNRLLLVVVVVPVAILLVTLAVANRADVPFTIDPFQPGNPALTLSLPLFVWLFAALGIGVFLGGAATWLRQGYYRRLARQNEREAAALRSQVVQRPPTVVATAPAGPVSGRPALTGPR